MSTLTNKVIWLTGASSGIGEALVYELVKKGVKLILSSRRIEELDRVKKNCPAEAQPYIHLLPLDLSKSATLQPATAAAIQLVGHIDILINNGGIGQRCLVRETSLEIDRQIMEVNYFGAVALTKYLLPHFISRNQGHYVTISSLAGKFGTPYRSGYAASKHALHGFYDAVRAEHWKDNLYVTMICPGFIRTKLPVSALTADPHTPNKIHEEKYKRKSADWCARKIVTAIEQKKEEVYIGGKEVWAVYIKRFFPSLLSKIIRKVPVR